MLSLAGLSLLLLAFFLGSASASVYLMTSTNETLLFPDLESNFTARIPSAGIRGVLHKASPSDGCSAVTNSPRPETPESYSVIIVIERGGCIFEKKVRNAQAAGFDAVIVYNNENNNDLVIMSGDSKGIDIYAIFVSKSAGETILSFADDMNSSCYIRGSFDRTWFVVAFTVVLAILVVVAICFLVRRHRHCSSPCFFERPHRHRSSWAGDSPSDSLPPPRNEEVVEPLLEENSVPISSSSKLEAVV